MDVSTALTKISYAVRGIDDDAPVFGDDEATYWVSVLNDKKDELYNDPNQSWINIFEVDAPEEKGLVSTAGTTTLTGSGTYFTDYKVGDKITVSGETVRVIDSITSDTSLEVTVAFSNTDSDLTFIHSTVIQAGVQTYSINRKFINPSDKIEILLSDGTKRYYDFIRPGARENATRGVYISSQNPQLLTFSTTIAADEDIVGGTLVIPGYYMPDDISLETDLLPFPDPNWGVFAAAAEIAFSDIVYEDKASDILAKANDLMRKMVAVNRKGTYGQPRMVYRPRTKLINPNNIDQ